MLAANTTSVEKAPSEPTFHFHLGMSYFRLGSKASAKASLNQAIKLNPFFPGVEEARTTLAKLQ
jgi:Flp pilus assembly protein TadD